MEYGRATSVIEPLILPVYAIGSTTKLANAR
jgi:hypothetical protein